MCSMETQQSSQFHPPVVSLNVGPRTLDKDDCLCVWIMNWLNPLRKQRDVDGCVCHRATRWDKQLFTLTLWSVWFNLNLWPQININIHSKTNRRYIYVYIYTATPVELLSMHDLFYRSYVIATVWLGCECWRSHWLLKVAFFPHQANGLIRFPASASCVHTQQTTTLCPLESCIIQLEVSEGS